MPLGRFDYGARSAEIFSAGASAGLNVSTSTFDQVLLKIIGLYRIVELLCSRVSAVRTNFCFTEGPRCIPLGTAPGVFSLTDSLHSQHSRSLVTLMVQPYDMYMHSYTHEQAPSASQTSWIQRYESSTDIFKIRKYEILLDCCSSLNSSRGATAPWSSNRDVGAAKTQVYDDDPPKVGACMRNHSESTPKATLKLNYRRPKRQIEVSSSSPQPRVVTAGDRANVWCLAEVVTFDPERVD